MSPHAASPSSIDPADVARFSAIADEWWRPTGPLGALHALNPVRLTFLRDQMLARFQRDGAARRPFEGLTLLDVGCGGGLLCEPMARLGFSVVGLDASEENIAVARAHAAEGGLSIDYRAATVEALRGAGEGAFDVVLNMEVIEHVADPKAFLRDCAALVAPGGLMVVATLNRTLKSLALAKIAAERILRWAPVGAHDWRKFLAPREIEGFLKGTGLTVEGPFGVVFDPRAWAWRRSADCDINYMMTASRPEKG